MSVPIHQGVSKQRPQEGSSFAAEVRVKAYQRAKANLIKFYEQQLLAKHASYMDRPSERNAEAESHFRRQLEQLFIELYCLCVHGRVDGKLVGGEEHAMEVFYDAKQIEDLAEFYGDGGRQETIDKEMQKAEKFVRRIKEIVPDLFEVAEAPLRVLRDEERAGEGESHLPAELQAIRESFDSATLGSVADRGSLLRRRTGSSNRTPRASMASSTSSTSSANFSRPFNHVNHPKTW
ncbi:hypothetical protein JCM10213_001779 [Rhodosporidiobolus nylandii]